MLITESNIIHRTSNKLIYSLQIQFQNLVKKEVTDRQIRDQAEIDEINQKGLFKIPVSMQMEQLKKVSKSIMDKTKEDIEKEKQDELDEVRFVNIFNHFRLNATFQHIKKNSTSTS